MTQALAAIIGLAKLSAAAASKIYGDRVALLPMSAVIRSGLDDENVKFYSFVAEHVGRASEKHRSLTLSQSRRQNKCSVCGNKTRLHLAQGFRSLHDLSHYRVEKTPLCDNEGCTKRYVWRNTPRGIQQAYAKLWA